jgi:hypothetical protein
MLPHFLFSFDDFISAKQKGNTPQACQTNDGVDDSAEQSILTTKNPGNQVELEDTDASPVQTADDGNN